MAKQPYVTKEDKIIISDLLYFIQNKVNAYANDDITNLCANLYTEECIWAEKERFFLAIDKKPIHSRGTSAEKVMKDLTDIISEIKKRDDNEDFQPTCVSIDMSNVPQSDDGTVSNSQILGSIKRTRKDMIDINSLKNEISSLKEDLIYNMKCCLRPARVPASPLTPRRMPMTPNQGSKRLYTGSDLNVNLLDSSESFGKDSA